MACFVDWANLRSPSERSYECSPWPPTKVAFKIGSCRTYRRTCFLLSGSVGLFVAKYIFSNIDDAFSCFRLHAKECSFSTFHSGHENCTSPACPLLSNGNFGLLRAPASKTRPRPPSRTLLNIADIVRAAVCSGYLCNGIGRGTFPWRNVDRMKWTKREKGVNGLAYEGHRSNWGCLQCRGQFSHMRCGLRVEGV